MSSFPFDKASAAAEATALKQVAATLDAYNENGWKEFLQFCTKKTEEYQNIDCSALKATQSSDFCTGTLLPTTSKPCCVNEVFRDTCDAMGCCRECHNPSDVTSDEYKASCTRKDFEGSTICGELSDGSGDTSVMKSGRCVASGRTVIPADVPCADGISKNVLLDVLYGRKGPRR